MPHFEWYRVWRQVPHIYKAKLVSHCACWCPSTYDDVIKWKHFPCYWPFVWGIHRLSVNSPHKSQWRWALMFPLICAWINGWVNNREVGDLIRHCGHYDVTVMHSQNKELTGSYNILSCGRCRVKSLYDIIRTLLCAHYRVWMSSSDPENWFRCKNKANTLKLEENGQHFADNIFKCIYLSKKNIIKSKFHRSLLLIFQLIILLHRFRKWPGAEQVITTIQSQWLRSSAMLQGITGPQWIKTSTLYQGSVSQSTLATETQFYETLMTLWFGK